MNVTPHTPDIIEFYEHAYESAVNKTRKPVNLDSTLYKRPSCYTMCYFMAKFIKSTTPNNEFVFSQMLVSKLTGYCEKAVSYSLHQLIERGHLELITQGSMKERRASVYKWLG